MIRAEQVTGGARAGKTLYSKENKEVDLKEADNANIYFVSVYTFQTSIWPLADQTERQRWELYDWLYIPS
jgi:hypothetical protein